MMYLDGNFFTITTHSYRFGGIQTHVECFIIFVHLHTDFSKNVYMFFVRWTLIIFNLKRIENVELT